MRGKGFAWRFILGGRIPSETENAFILWLPRYLDACLPERWISGRRAETTRPHGRPHGVLYERTHVCNVWGGLRLNHS